MKDQEQVYLKLCRHRIEQKVGYGSADEWTNQDFVQLSEFIFNETKVNLSTTTLKRLWGKVKYDSSPNISTLNVLAQFIGDQDWRTFKMNCQKVPGHKAYSKLDKLAKRRINSTFPALDFPSQNQHGERKSVLNAFVISLMLFISVSTLLALLLSWQAQKDNRQALSKHLYYFSAETVASGLPNTVIFDYDASSAPTDHIYIQHANQNEEKTKISRDEHRLTSMFYYPGAYQAHLMVDDTIVGQQDFQINTQGWLALVEQDPMPHYYKENIFNEGKLGLPLKTLKDSAFDLQQHIPWVSYYNVQDFGDLYNDNFILETAIKSEFNQGNAVCQDSTVVILFQNAPPLSIPLSIPGCLAQTDKLLKEQKLQNENINLLAFGTDFSDWIEVKCEAKDQQFRVFINQKLAYEEVQKDKGSKIVGIAYRFHGTGSVNYVRLSQGGGEVVFYDDFS